MLRCVTETLAAAIELAMGNPWGIGGSLIIGICQGLTAEIGFAIFAYKRWDLLSATISGTLAGLGMLPLQLDRKPRLGRLAYCRQLRHFRYFRRFGGWKLLMYLLQQAIAKQACLDRFESVVRRLWSDGFVCEVPYRIHGRWIRDFFDACSPYERQMQKE